MFTEFVSRVSPPFQYWSQRLAGFSLAQDISDSVLLGFFLTRLILPKPQPLCDLFSFISPYPSLALILFYYYPGVLATPPFPLFFSQDQPDPVFHLFQSLSPLLFHSSPPPSLIPSCSKELGTVVLLVCFFPSFFKDMNLLLVTGLTLHNPPPHESSFLPGSPPSPLVLCSCFLFSPLILNYG